MTNTQLVPVILPNGTIVKMEARKSGEGDISAFEGLPEPLSLEMMQSAISGVAELVDKALDKVKPQKVSVEFSVELSFEAGKLTSLIVNGSTKGSIKIGLEWAPTAVAAK